MAADNQLLAEYGRTRSEALLDEICRQYLPLAGAIARRFSGRGVDYDDLYQVSSRPFSALTQTRAFSSALM